MKPGLEEDREIQIGLTRRQAEIVMTAIRHAIRKAQANIRRDPDFVPEPGRFDANRMRVGVLTEVHESLHRKYRAAYGQPEDNCGSLLTDPGRTARETEGTGSPSEPLPGVG